MVAKAYKYFNAKKAGCQLKGTTGYQVHVTCCRYTHVDWGNVYRKCEWLMSAVLEENSNTLNYLILANKRYNNMIYEASSKFYVKAGFRGYSIVLQRLEVFLHN